MQRYEREIEELLRDLQFGDTPSSPRERESERAQTRRRLTGIPWRRSIPIVSPLAPRIDASVIKGTCLVLISALVLVPYVPLISAGLILVAIGLLTASLRNSRLAADAENGSAARDLRWTDVTTQSRPGTSGAPGSPGAQRKPGDFMF